jgi:membrane protein
VNVVEFLRERPLWPLTIVIVFFRDWIARFLSVQGIDRAMAIAAQAYSAFLPAVIVYASVLPRADNEDFADVLVDRFDLSGAAATSVQQAFAPAGAVESSITGIGVVLLLVSALSFTRGLQRLYEGVFGLPALGMRNTPRALLWLAFVGLVAAVRPLATGPFDGVVRSVANVAIAVFVWLVTPYLLLGRRVPWRELVPTALLSAIGMTGVAVWSVIWMPRAFATSAQQFGMFGIGFAILAWFVAVACVLVVAAAGGALIAEKIGRRFGRGGAVSREAPAPSRLARAR